MTPAPTPGYPTLRMSSEKYTIVRDIDSELVDAEYTTYDPEEADELLEMAHARRGLTSDADRWYC